jgi:hypothetical protein
MNPRPLQYVRVRIWHLPLTRMHGARYLDQVGDMWRPLKEGFMTVRIYMIVLLSVAALVRAPGLFRALWYDEIFTDMMTRSLRDIPAALIRDVHSPSSLF